MFALPRVLREMFSHCQISDNICSKNTCFRIHEHTSHAFLHYFLHHNLLENEEIADDKRKCDGLIVETFFLFDA